MTTYSSDMTEKGRAALVVNLGERSTLSGEDGCVVVIVRCSICGGVFEEELERAGEMAIAGEESVCLFCDEDATQPALSKVL